MDQLVSQHTNASVEARDVVTIGIGFAVDIPLAAVPAPSAVLAVC